MLTKSEVLILKAYLNLPCRKLLNHQYESEEDCLAGYIDRFLHGERFDRIIVPFKDEDYEAMEHIAMNNLCNSDGADLLTALWVTMAACNILNKYRK